MIIESHHKFIMDITKIIDRHIQIHSHIGLYFDINSNSHFQNI